MNQEVIDLMNQLTAKEEEIKVLKFRETNVTTERDIAWLEIERLKTALQDAVLPTGW